MFAFEKCRELAKDFVVAGTASESLYGACEAMFKPDMVCKPTLLICKLENVIFMDKMHCIYVCTF